MALAEQALGHWAAAEANLQEALRASADPWITKNRSTLESSLAVIDQRLGTLEILGQPVGAEVRVEGQVVGTLPLNKPLRVTAGGVAIELRAPGHITIARSVTVPAGELTRENIVLQPAPKETTKLSEDASGIPPPMAVPHSGSADRTAPAQGTRTAAWVTLGAAGLLLAGGGTGLVIREVLAQKHNRNCAPGVPNPDITACEDSGATGDLVLKLSIVSLAAGSVMGVISWVLFARSSAPAPKTASTNLACLPSGFNFGLACAATF
jgi:hypothetical protein